MSVAEQHETAGNGGKKTDDLEQTREFLARVSQELGIDAAVVDEVVPHLLGLTKRVAHGVDRPAAPLAAFAVGLASAHRNTGQVRENITRVHEAIASWQRGGADS